MTVDHVVFTGCKLDYATLDEIKATGPVLFAGCSLREAALTGCSLAGSLFDDCSTGQDTTCPTGRTMLLLDSQAVLWLLDDNQRLGPRAREAIRSAQGVHVSAVTVWELTI